MASDEVPSLAWFGQSLPAVPDDKLIATLDLANGHAKLDQQTPLSIFPTDGTGFQGQPALLGHSQGRRFSAVFKQVSVQQTDHRLIFSLLDSVNSLAVELSMELDPGSSVLTLQTTLENQGEDDYQVDWLASGTIPLPDTYSECLTLHGRWGLEFQMQRQPITAARLQIENRTGRTSHEHFPGCLAGTAHFSEYTGTVHGMHLAYSGNYRLGIERLSTGTAFMQAGCLHLPGESLLAQGEKLQSPPLHVCHANGMHGISRRFHHYVRNHVLPAWTRAPRPIHANSWEALYFDHSTEKMLPLIDAAAAIGAERFVLDDGWFEARRNDTAGLGDWRVDKSIYPDGLHAIVTHIRDKGMQFGLWFEPEMVNPDSRLFREHPDWILQVENISTPLARNQLTLNLDLEEVQTYLFNCIESLVDEYDIDYIKWDMNRDLVLAGSHGRASVQKQVQGVYSLLHRLTHRFPALEIESCSSGGARADMGILSYTGRIWTSDSIDAIDRLRIQRGFSLFFPPEIMGSHVGQDTAHLTGRSLSIHTRAAVAVLGQYGFELDATRLDTIERSHLSHYTAIYKRCRNWMADAITYRTDTRDERLFIQGLVAANQQQSLWSVVAETSLLTTSPERLILRGLNKHTRYTIAVAHHEHLHYYCKKIPVWVTAGVTISGELLMTTGLTLPVMPAQSALLIECAAVSDTSGTT
ncbi:MAG: alpha-galactosidase [Granulosicoccus sp.]|nr:alpha-galactosidase [Granulosicoccus sp.]